jgi:DNA end-binding protein Ku
MKSVWKGYLGFGLVNIPVSLYTATEQNKINFHLLHKDDNERIRYNRVCSECGKKVQWDDIVKGLEVGKDEYYVLTKEEINELKPEGDELIEIHEFVNRREIEPIYLTKHYYIGPISGAERPYFLLKGTIGSKDKVAIATFVMREKKYLCMIQDYKKGLLLSLLHYADEIRDIENVPNIDFDPPKLKENEIELADQLIEKLSNTQLNIQKYKDTYTENLKEAIKQKSKGELISKRKKKTVKTEDLIASLKASVEK